MKTLTILGIFALFLLLVIPGAVSAADVTVSGSILPDAPVAAFSASPTFGAETLTVDFTDASTPDGYIDTWMWEYRVTGTDTWTLFDDSAEQNPTQDFDAGYFDIRLTVANDAGSDEEIKLKYIRVSTGPLPLETVQSGTVSGDLYFSAVQPTPFNVQTLNTGVTQEATFEFAPSGYTSIEWARFYTMVYVMGQDERECVVSVSFDGNNDGIYETVLDDAVTLNTATGGSNGNVWWQGDHINRVYSDYVMFYDVKDSINSGTVKAKVQTALGASTMDGRIKYLALVVAYNDSDSDQVKYWVNDGHAWTASMATGQTEYATETLNAGFSDAELKLLHTASSDAKYTFNGASKTGANPPSGTFFGLNIWDVKDDIAIGNPSTLSYYKDTSMSYKTTIAPLKARYTAPTAAFSATPTTIDAGQSVAFDASASTGSITSYTWDFGDSASDSGKTTSHTYATAGTYTVTLTVDGPMGSDTETATITVKEPAPVIDFSASKTNPMVGESITFTGTNTGGAVNNWAWDFGDGTGSGQIASHTYNSAGTYTVTLTATGPDYTDFETKTNYITVGAASIDVSVTDAAIDFGTMAAGVDETGSTTVNVDVTYGTAWSVTAAANNGGYMKAGALQLESPFQLSNGGEFSPMTSNFANFLTGAAGVDGSGPANVKQAIAAADAPGAYSITLTFTGTMA